MGPLKSVPYFFLFFLLIPVPFYLSGHRALTPAFSSATPAPSAASHSIEEEALSLYNEMGLSRTGLHALAFQYAWLGYKRLLESGQLVRTGVISICDFSQSSRRKRLYILDVSSKKVLLQTYVAHGRNSGGEYARAFSNRPDSYKSSLGFYITRNTYYGGHGLALNIDGQERGINDRADDRKIVIHGSRYVGANYLRHHKYNGRSLGCPAVPLRETRNIIRAIQGGSCFFIYHPSEEYRKKSTLLNS